MRKVCFWFYGYGKISLKAKGPPKFIKGSLRVVYECVLPW